MKKFLSTFLATSMVMAACVATASVASAEVSSVNLPTTSGQFYTIEGEDYTNAVTYTAANEVKNESSTWTSSTTADVQRKSSGTGVLKGNTLNGVLDANLPDNKVGQLTFNLYVEKDTEYDLEVVTGGGNVIYNNNYFTLDGTIIITTNTRNSSPDVAVEVLEWSAGKQDSNDYHRAIKYTRRVLLTAGPHTLVLNIPNRNSSTKYGNFMLDYIKLTSCDVVKAYKTVEADNNFTRFEMSESFTNGETKTIKFTPSRTADYSLSVGTGAYRGTDITTDIASLSFTVTDSNGTKIMENLAVTPSPRNIQRVGANDFTADNLALEAGKEYTISVTATLNDGKTEGSISYIDLRCLTLDIGTQPALISALDYYKIAHNGGGSTGGPNANTYWVTAKWNQMGSNLIGNYMDEDLAAKNECATSFHNANATYKLNFTESGTYKVRLYGLNLATLNEGEASPKAAVSLDGDTLGTAVYANDADGLADAAISTKRKLEPMDCPHTLYVTAGTYDMVVGTMSPDKLAIAGIVIEKVPSVSFAETVITDETTNVTANADYQNRTDESVTLYVALYDVNGRLLKVESTYSTESTDTLSKTVSLVPNTYTAKAFVWGDNLEPLYEYAAISKISSVIACWGDSLTAGADGRGTTYPGVLAGKVGSNYTVLNMGIGGETAWTIAGRQGGIPMQVNEFTIPADTEKVEITFANNVNPLLQGDKGINPCYINSIEGTLSYDAELEKYYFSRTNAGEETAVSQGTIVETNAMRERNNDTLILWVGSNGPHGTDDPETLIDIQKKMIAQNNSENYLIVGLTIEDAATRSKLEIASRKEFGNKYLNLRKYLSNEETLRQAGITPTENDLDDIKHGRVPDSLHYDDPVHLNALGYTLTANAIYDRIKELGYVK